MTEKRKELVNKLNRIFRDTFDDDQIEIFDDMTAKDIEEWDSLMQITLIVAIEKEFRIRLKAEEIGQLRNVGDMLSILDERGNQVVVCSRLFAETS